ncbi:MAG: hypothetical protein KDD11_02785 [Acidobacteria bacterium]|nr:hypothetical protein [Acidobacteriota bacterium]
MSDRQGTAATFPPAVRRIAPHLELRRRLDRDDLEQLIEDLQETVALPAAPDETPGLE